MDFANTAVYERYAAMEEEAFVNSVCAGVPRLCSDTHPTIREVFEYIGALDGEPSSSGSQGPTLSGTAHPLATYATEAARRLTKRLRALERAASRLKRPTHSAGAAVCLGVEARTVSSQCRRISST